MSSRDSDISTLLAERITVGLSTIVGITAWPGQVSLDIKYLSGGSLEIGGTYSLSAGATTAFAWGKGYLFGTSEVLSFDGAGQFYLAATGATAICHVIRGQCQGALDR